MANAICERLIGTVRRECLNWLIPISETHLRLPLKEWGTHYNDARPHMALGPGIPDAPATLVLSANQICWHRSGAQLVVQSKCVLRGLHHEYSLVSAFARAGFCRGRSSFCEAQRFCSRFQSWRQRDAYRSTLLRGTLDSKDGFNQLCLLTQTREAVMPRMRGLHVESDAIVDDCQR